ncbi:unnamed protein product [Auanema sp. JU1783]|nr:unnamed protein product [Auanema sp. JU1783]
MIWTLLLFGICHVVYSQSIYDDYHYQQSLSQLGQQPQIFIPYIQSSPVGTMNYVQLGPKNLTNPFAAVIASPSLSLPGSPTPASAVPIPRECGPEEQERVRQCADPLYRVGALAEDGGSLSWQHFLSRTREYFTDVCDNFFIFDLCIEPYKDVCFDSSKARFRYDAALKVLDFICRDGYGELMRNFDCFTKTLTRAEMMQCQAEMVADTRKVPQGSDVVTRNAAACGAMRNYVDCVRYPVRYECGYRAWQLIRELIVRPTEALLPGCQLNSARSFLSLNFVILFIAWLYL